MKRVVGHHRLTEELLGICIERMDWRRPASVTIRDLTQAGREDFWVKGASMKIGSGLAGLKNTVHDSVITIRLYLCPTQSLFRPGLHLLAGIEIILSFFVS
jgi:hypothetical protein